MQSGINWKNAPTWQDVIDFSKRVIGELEPLVEDDKHNIILLMFMNKAINLKHHATLEQQKEQTNGKVH